VIAVASTVRPHVTRILPEFSIDHYRDPGGLRIMWALPWPRCGTTKLRETVSEYPLLTPKGPARTLKPSESADADMILVEEFFCSMAYHGTGIYKGRSVPELRGITALWPDAVHFLGGSRQGLSPEQSRTFSGLLWHGIAG